jgi:hypothetical protein
VLQPELTDADVRHSTQASTGHLTRDWV